MFVVADLVDVFDYRLYIGVRHCVLSTEKRLRGFKVHSPRVKEPYHFAPGSTRKGERNFFCFRPIELGAWPSGRARMVAKVNEKKEGKDIVEVEDARER